MRDAPSTHSEPFVAAAASEPYYREIAYKLRTQLLSGSFRPGQRFFTIRALMKETGRSLPTVRSALGLLIHEGLLEARRGSGYYVTDKVSTVSGRTHLSLLAVIPSYVSPKEPWFTGRLVSGMVHAVENSNVLISFFQRQVVFSEKVENVQLQLAVPDERMARMDEERIAAANPDGMAWIHTSQADAPLLKQLVAQGIPIVTTIRRLPEVDLPLVREDDTVYASMLLSQLHAHGHRRIGFITRGLDDDYFGSKMAAIHAVKGSLGLDIDDSDLFYLGRERIPLDDYAMKLGAFLEARPHLTVLVVLASSGIYPLIRLMELRPGERLSRLSVVYNVLDGVRIPTLPTGASLARLSPPLEQLGAQLVRNLIARIRGELPPKHSVLVPVFEPGDSLRRI